METNSLVTLIGVILTSLATLISVYFAYRTADNKKVFDLEKQSLELDCKKLRIEHDKLQGDYEILKDKISELKVRVEAFQISETKTLKEKELIEIQRDDYKDKYMNLLEKC